MRTSLSNIAAVALAAPALALAAPAAAAPAAHAAAWAPATWSNGAVWTDVAAEHGRKHRRHYERYNDGRYYNNGYGYQQSYYGEPVYANTRVWQGDDGRYYCRRSNGTTGLLIGAAGGALLGRAIDRSSTRCR